MEKFTKSTGIFTSAIRQHFTKLLRAKPWKRIEIIPALEEGINLCSHLTVIAKLF